MRPRYQLWGTIGLVLLLVGAALGGALWYRSRQSFDAARLLQTLPPDRSVHVYIDFAQLRAAGLLDLLTGSQTAQDADYKRFVEQTGFNYQADLEAVAAGFSGANMYLAARGRFDWKRLAAYAQSQNGFCQNSMCSMPANQPGKSISYYMLRPAVLALAVSPEQRGATMIGPYQWPKPPKLPEAPLWISAPAFAFADLKGLPAGTQAFLSPLARAQGTTFSAGAAPGDPKRFQIQMEIACNTPAEAAELAKQLSATTELLRKMLSRDKLTPNSADLSGVLVAGRFEQKETHVSGVWPIERSFLESLASGKIQ